MENKKDINMKIIQSVVGGRKELSKITGVGYMSITNWIRRNKIPKEKMKKIVEKFVEKNIDPEIIFTK